MASGYWHVHAQQLATARRGPQRKLIRHDALRLAVIDRLQEGWSPEQIAGRMRFENHRHRVCHETIYRYVCSPDGQAQGLGRHLPERRRKRKARYARKSRNLVFPERCMIRYRPEAVGNRDAFGHWEAELMIFRREHGPANVATAVERVSRFTVLFRNNDRRPRPIMNKPDRPLPRKLGDRMILPRTPCRLSSVTQGAALIGRRRRCRETAGRRGRSHAFRAGAWILIKLTASKRRNPCRNAGDRPQGRCVLAMPFAFPSGLAAVLPRPGFRERPGRRSPRRACSMLHAPCSMLHAPCSMLHAPCSMLHAPCSMLRAGRPRARPGHGLLASRDRNCVGNSCSSRVSVTASSAFATKTRRSMGLSSRGTSSSGPPKPRSNMARQVGRPTTG